MHEWEPVNSWAVTFSNKFFLPAPFAPTNSQLSLNPRELMLVLPSSAISFFASLSNLSKWVSSCQSLQLFFYVLSWGGGILCCRFIKRRYQHDGADLDVLQEGDERFHLCREKPRVKLRTQVWALLVHSSWPTLTAAIHVKVARPHDGPCFTCVKYSSQAQFRSGKSLEMPRYCKYEQTTRDHRSCLQVI